MTYRNTAWITFHYSSKNDARVRAANVETNSRQIIYDGQVVAVSKDLTGITIEFQNGNSSRSIGRNQF